MTPVTQNMIYFWQGVRKQKPESWFSKNDPMISGSAHWGLSCDPSDFPVHPCSREMPEAAVLSLPDPFQNTQAIASKKETKSSLRVQYSFIQLHPIHTCLVPTPQPGPKDLTTSQPVRLLVLCLCKLVEEQERAGSQPGIVVHACNPSTRETEAGGLSGV